MPGLRHPQGVQPRYGDGGDDATRRRGLGALHALPDECLLNILYSMDAQSLGRLAVVSRALWAFACHEDLWKGLVLQELGGRWAWAGGWRPTYVSASVPGWRPAPPAPAGRPALRSDVLYQPWLYSVTAIDPDWLEEDNVRRRAGLTPEAFRAEYELPARPVILTDVVPKWPAVKKWSRPYLATAFKGGSVIVGDAPMPFDTYCRYCDSNSDEQPLYLFDKTFLQTAPHLAGDYTVPEHFCDDLFSLLGGARPDHRWLIIGPHRSGSGWHRDPNQTHAINAVVRGSKKWLLYPPAATPPGVRASADGADVASTISLTEWFVNYYDQRFAGGVAPVECVQRAGELLFVPRGWWHCALNLEETVAITHNYVSPSNLPDVLSFLSTRNPALISGLPCDEARIALYDTFVEALEKERPEALAAARQALEERARRARERSKLASLFHREPAQGEKQVAEAGTACAAPAGDGAAHGTANGGASPAPGAAAGGFSFSFNL